MAHQQNSLAKETLDEKERRKKKKAAKSPASGSVERGAASGAITGASAGPVGAIAGAAIGAGSSLLESREARKEADKLKPSRRKLKAGIDSFNKAKQSKERALATLSQAVFDWAASIR